MAGGRPSKFKPEYVTQAAKLCALGATDLQIAEFFDVSEVTINNWKIAHPEFLESLKSAKSVLDAEVEQSLYRRAMGYSHGAEKIAFDKDGNELRAAYTEHYPPSEVACIFWLKNRQPAKWRDKQEHEHSGEIIVNINRKPKPSGA